MTAGRDDLFIACAPGLEPWLAAEVRACGLGEPREVPGGVELGGDRTTMWRANLELGLASHVRIRVDELGAKHFGELVRKVAAVDWGRWVSPHARVRVHATARASRLHHTGAIAERVQRGIAHALGREPDAKPRAAEVTVHARFDRDVCTLSLETSGEPLHRRGYRLATAKAPLREDLARALVVVSGWDRASPLLDPMMGAGTVVIEAAMLARGLPPGGLRPRFAFMDLAGFDANAWQTVRAEALGRARPALDVPIVGRDRDAGAVEAARANAERAGVLADLKLARAPLGERFWPEGPVPPKGALVTNPPHGRRIGKRSSLAALHHGIGRLVTGLPPAWHVALLTSDRRLALQSGLELRTALLTDQGGTKVRILVRDPSPGPT